MSNINYHDSLLVAPLRIIALNNCKELGEKVNQLIIERRHKALSEAGIRNSSFKMQEYDRDDYLVSYDCPRFGTGEGRAVINQSIRGTDLFIIADTVNYSELFKMHGSISQMSPDDHFMDLKRVIMACGGSPRRITVIMPYLYEGRQNVRMANESLDCAQALQELTEMGVETIITFDAHDSRVQNAIPIHGFDNFYTSYQFIREIFDGKSPDDFDEETLVTINKFFENSLNVSETSRQLYIHRNTLVYRLDKLQKSTGLDLRVFEDAITFKIALMVVKYMKYMENQEY